MTASVIPKHFTDGEISFADGTGTPVTLTLPLGEGDVKVSDLVPDQRDVHVYYARADLVGLRLGKRKPVNVSFSAILGDLSDGTDGTAADFCLQRGSYSGNTSTTTALGDVYTIDITLTMTYAGDAAAHTVPLTDVHVTMAIEEGEPTKLTFSGICYGGMPAMT